MKPNTLLDYELRISVRTIGLMAVCPMAIIGLFFLLRVPNAASWFQAIGAVAAVISAIVISNAQSHAAKVSELTKQAQYTWKAESVANQIAALMEETCYTKTFINTQAVFFRAMSNRGENLNATLHNIMGHPLTPTTIEAVMKVHEELSRFLSEISQADDNYMAPLKQRISTVKALRKTTYDEYVRLSKLAGIGYTQRVVPE